MSNITWKLGDTQSPPSLPHFLDENQNSVLQLASKFQTNAKPPERLFTELKTSPQAAEAWRDFTYVSDSLLEAWIVSQLKLLVTGATLLQHHEDLPTFCSMNAARLLQLASQHCRDKSRRPGNEAEDIVQAMQASLLGSQSNPWKDAPTDPGILETWIRKRLRWTEGDMRRQWERGPRQSKETTTPDDAEFTAHNHKTPSIDHSSTSKHRLPNKAMPFPQGYDTPARSCELNDLQIDLSDTQKNVVGLRLRGYSWEEVRKVLEITHEELQRIRYDISSLTQPSGDQV